MLKFPAVHRFFFLGWSQIFKLPCQKTHLTEKIRDCSLRNVLGYFVISRPNRCVRDEKHESNS